MNFQWGKLWWENDQGNAELFWDTMKSYCYMTKLCISWVWAVPRNNGCFLRALKTIWEWLAIQTHDNQWQKCLWNFQQNKSWKNERKFHGILAWMIFKIGLSFWEQKRKPWGVLYKNKKLSTKRWEILNECLKDCWYVQFVWLRKAWYKIGPGFCWTDYLRY